MQIHVALENIIKTYTFPDDTAFEMNAPLPGFVRVVPMVGDRSQSWWFNTAYIIAITPDTTVPR